MFYIPAPYQGRWSWSFWPGWYLSYVPWLGQVVLLGPAKLPPTITLVVGLRCWILNQIGLKGPTLIMRSGSACFGANLRLEVLVHLQFTHGTYESNKWRIFKKKLPTLPAKNPQKTRKTPANSRKNPQIQKRRFFIFQYVPCDCWNMTSIVKKNRSHSRICDFYFYSMACEWSLPKSYMYNATSKAQVRFYWV